MGCFSGVVWWPGGGPVVGVCTGPRVVLLCVPLVVLVPVLWCEVEVGCGGTFVEVWLCAVELVMVAVVLLPELGLVGWWLGLGTGMDVEGEMGRQAPA